MELNVGLTMFTARIEEMKDELKASRKELLQIMASLIETVIQRYRLAIQKQQLLLLLMTGAPQRTSLDVPYSMEDAKEQLQILTNEIIILTQEENRNSLLVANHMQLMEKQRAEIEALQIEMEESSKLLMEQPDSFELQQHYNLSTEKYESVSNAFDRASLEWTLSSQHLHSLLTQKNSSLQKLEALSKQLQQLETLQVSYKQTKQNWILLGERLAIALQSYEKRNVEINSLVSAIIKNSEHLETAQHIHTLAKNLHSSHQRLLSELRRFVDSISNSKNNNDDDDNNDDNNNDDDDDERLKQTENRIRELVYAVRYDYASIFGLFRLSKEFGKRIRPEFENGEVDEREEEEIDNEMPENEAEEEEEDAELFDEDDDTATIVISAAMEDATTNEGKSKDRDHIENLEDHDSELFRNVPLAPLLPPSSRISLPSSSKLIAPEVMIGTSLLSNEANASDDVLRALPAVHTRKQLDHPISSIESTEVDDRISEGVSLNSVINSIDGLSKSLADDGTKDLPKLNMETTIAPKLVSTRNEHALNILRRVREKLLGEDFALSNHRMSVQEQVDAIICEATKIDNLCVLYEGWTPWI